MFYVLINSKGIEVREVEKILALKEMQHLVGVDGKPAYIEVASYRSFSDDSITMLCDDEFLLKELKPTCMTREGSIIHGQVLVVGTNKQGDDFDLLNSQQVKIVKSQARLVRSLTH